jgi:hypothetical protein
MEESETTARVIRPSTQHGLARFASPFTGAAPPCLPGILRPKGNRCLKPTCLVPLTQTLTSSQLRDTP